MDDIYNSKILEFAGNIPRIGTLDDADASAQAHSKLCGSRVKIWLKMDGDVVTDFAHEVKACALGQASSSIMARHVVGATVDGTPPGAGADMLAMLKDGRRGAGSAGSRTCAICSPVKDYKARHASTMLTFDAVVDAIDQIEAKRGIDCGGLSMCDAHRDAGHAADDSRGHIPQLCRPFPQDPRPAVRHGPHPPLPADAFRLHRQFLPPSADLLGIWLRGDRPPRPLARRLDDACFASARCGPGGTSGFDPVPESLEPRYRWWTPWRYFRLHQLAVGLMSTAAHGRVEPDGRA